VLIQIAIVLPLLGSLVWAYGRWVGHLALIWQILFWIIFGALGLIALLSLVGFVRILVLLAGMRKVERLFHARQVAPLGAKGLEEALKARARLHVFAQVLGADDKLTRQELAEVATFVRGMFHGNSEAFGSDTAFEVIVSDAKRYAQDRQQLEYAADLLRGPDSDEENFELLVSSLAAVQRAGQVGKPEIEVAGLAAEKMGLDAVQVRSFAEDAAAAARAAQGDTAARDRIAALRRELEGEAKAVEEGGPYGNLLLRIRGYMQVGVLGEEDGKKLAQPIISRMRGGLQRMRALAEAVRKA
jgi:hypothetical protein